MSAKNKERNRTRFFPKAGRPQIAEYGISKKKQGILPWRWAEQRLQKSREYWIATTCPDGSPHVMVIWGLWLDDGFYFSTGKHSRKARNLAGNPRCVICSSDPAEAVIVEGVVEIVPAAHLALVYSAYKKKYKMDISGMEEPIYRVTPHTAFGLIEKKFAETATRWKF